MDWGPNSARSTAFCMCRRFSASLEISCARGCIDASSDCRSGCTGSVVSGHRMKRMARLCCRTHCVLLRLSFLAHWQNAVGPCCRGEEKGKWSRLPYRARAIRIRGWTIGVVWRVRPSKWGVRCGRERCTACEQAYRCLRKRALNGEDRCATGIDQRPCKRYNGTSCPSGVQKIKNCFIF